MYREFAVDNARRRDQANRDARQAWLTVQIYAAARGAKQFPRLERWLIKDTDDAATDEAAAGASNLAGLQASVFMLSEKYGIPVGKTRLIKRVK